MDSTPSRRLRQNSSVSLAPGKRQAMPTTATASGFSVRAGLSTLPLLPHLLRTLTERRALHAGALVDAARERLGTLVVIARREVFGQRGDGRVLEQLHERQLAAERLRQLALHAEHQQRVAA